MKWGTIVPLIGGIVYAGKVATGVDPQFMISYKPFAENEKNAKAYFPHVPHYLLDEPDHGGFDIQAHQDMDFIQALCPCAGLSQLSSGTMEQRDTMNKWMIESARFVTSEVKPKVFWGENAPGLYTKAGDRVRAQLREIAAENGYSFSIYCTNTYYHGIPQSRKRTFYFFWRDSNAPIFEYYRTPMPTLADYMNQVPVGVLYHTPEEIEEARQKLFADPFIHFMQHKYGADQAINQLRNYVIEKDKTNTTINTYLIKSEQMEEARDWFEKQQDVPLYAKAYKQAVRMLTKIATGGGIWDGSYPVYRALGHSSTLISRTLSAIHPTEDRLLTTRECMHLMGLPHDYPLVTNERNNICQNVPVCTAADMTREVMGFIRGERQISNAEYVLQSNLTGTVDVAQCSLLEF